MLNPLAPTRKKISVALALILGLSASAAWSWAGNNSASASSTATPSGAAASTAATAAASHNSGKESATPDPNSPIVAELQELKEAVQAQAQQFDQHTRELESERAALQDELAKIAALEAKLGVTPTVTPAVAPAAQGPAAPAGGEAVAAIPPQAIGTQAQTPQDLSNRIANLENRVKNFGPFTFSGDFRLRNEPFFGGPANQSLDQDRERFRLRLNLDAKLNDDFSGGFSLASGDINDPTSTNQTVTGFYTRKAIAIDKAFVDYTPHQLHALTLIGGKFGYPWYNTELTWDKDLNPEGVAETLAFDLHSMPVLKKIAFAGFQLPFSQVAGQSLNNQSLVTSAVYGGQIQTTWQLTHWLKFGAFTGFYNFHNADPIALALAKASAKNPQTPLTGLLPLGTGNTVQNSIVTTTSTNIVTIDGTAYPTGVTSVTNAQFASKFGLFDSLARFDIATPFQKWPIALIGDYVQNTEACANVNNIKAAPVDTSTVTYTQSTNFSCDPNQRRGYWAEVQIGRASKRGDWQFDYTHMFIEREAVLSNFDYSDIRQGSNVTEHRFMAIYQVHRNVQLSFTGLIGRPLNFGGTTPPQDYLKRLQFDVVYSF